MKLLKKKVNTKMKRLTMICQHSSNATAYHPPHLSANSHQQVTMIILTTVIQMTMTSPSCLLIMSPNPIQSIHYLVVKKMKTRMDTERRR